MNLFNVPLLLLPLRPGWNRMGWAAGFSSPIRSASQNPLSSSFFLLAAAPRAGGPLIPVPPPGIWYRRPSPPAVCPISQICRARRKTLLPTGGCTFTALLPLRSSLSRVRPTTKSGLRPADGGGEGEERREERERNGVVHC